MKRTITLTEEQQPNGDRAFIAETFIDGRLARGTSVASAAEMEHTKGDPRVATYHQVRAIRCALESLL